MDDKKSGPESHTISVIVSHFNSKRTIKQCLLCILNQDFPSDKFEIIVVDAGSNDGSVEIVHQLVDPRVRQIVVPGCTEPEGHIIGVQSAKNEIIMFTNSDIYVPRNWMKKHLEWLDNGYDLVGGKVLWGGDKFAFPWTMPAPKEPQIVQQQGLGLGFSNCSVRKDFMLTIGGLKNLSSQHDTEFAFRVIRYGGKMILDPEIEVYHDHPFKSVRGSFLRSKGYALNHVIVMRATYGRLVSGSGAPAMISIGTLAREWFLINAVHAYRQNIKAARKWNIDSGLLDFIRIRLIAVKLGQFVGILQGMSIRNVAYSSIPDLHKQIEKIHSPQKEVKIL